MLSCCYKVLQAIDQRLLENSLKDFAVNRHDADGPKSI